jgi:DNA-binding response OmpR family regulator
MTKILIAEDDDHTRDALREVLTMEGYEVIPRQRRPAGRGFFPRRES